MKIQLNQNEISWILTLLRNHMEEMKDFENGYNPETMLNLQKLEDKLIKSKALLIGE